MNADQQPTAAESTPAVKPPRSAAAIRKELDAIAPWPETGEVSAESLARYHAVVALEYRARTMESAPIGSETWHLRVSLMCAHFSAALALAALADPLTPPLWGRPGFGATSPGELARAAAAQIRDSLEDGESSGEWLWEYLGSDEAERVSALGAELLTAIEAARRTTPRWTCTRDELARALKFAGVADSGKAACRVLRYLPAVPEASPEDGAEPGRVTAR